MEKKTIQLPKDLYDKAEAAKNQAGMQSVDEYVAFVLSEVLAQMDAGPDEDVKKRLKALGYRE